MPQYTRVLALGDSETYGARATHGRTYPTYLEEQLAEVHTNVSSILINAGVNGERSWEIVDRGVQHLLSDEWIKIVLCMMGTNDSKPGSNTPIGYYMKQWDRLLRACRATDTMLVPLQIHAIDPFNQPEYDSESINRIRDYNNSVEVWADNNNLTYIDGLFQPFLDNPRLLADGIHPTNSGNELIADRIFQYLGKPLAARRSAVTVPQQTDVDSEHDDTWGGPNKPTIIEGGQISTKVIGTMINGNTPASVSGGASRGI